jgi:hypothetical protein
MGKVAEASPFARAERAGRLYLRGTYYFAFAEERVEFGSVGSEVFSCAFTIEVSSCSFRLSLESPERRILKLLLKDAERRRSSRVELPHS